MDRYRFRAPIARARGLGSAKGGFEHWWVERITAVALVPLTIWFVACAIAYGGEDYETFVAWLSAPVTVVLMTLLLVSLFWHTALGLQVIVEDYVHSGAKIWMLLAIRFFCFALATTGILATLRVALISWAAA